MTSAQEEYRAGRCVEQGSGEGGREEVEPWGGRWMGRGGEQRGGGDGGVENDEPPRGRKRRKDKS